MPRFPVLALATAVYLAASPAGAQSISAPKGIGPLAAAVQGDLRGTVLDDNGQPLAGVVISAVGATSVFAVSESDGAFIFRHLPAGAYLVRAHMQGYVPPRARMIQINNGTQYVPAISLAKAPAAAAAEPRVLEAGIGATATSGDTTAPPADAPDSSEVAWRLRHAKRSVLKDAQFMLPADDGGDELHLASALGYPARVAGAWFADLTLNGQINLLTRATFERPDDLLSLAGSTPRGVTYISLAAPTLGGEWSMRGAMTQGDVSSWILSGAYERSGPVAHQYEAGLSYGTQRYLGGNADAFVAVSDGNRNVGAVFAYDHWGLSPRLQITYGGKYARYDYLTDRGLFSPTAAMTLAPISGDTLRLHAAVSRREVAPGADEFLPPSTGLWLPPERTFSPIRRDSELMPERVNHFELSAERAWFGDVVIGLRAFRQTIDDQIVTMFGVELPDRPSASVGHYYVGSAGAVDAAGWGVGVRRAVGDRFRAAVDYTKIDAMWRGGSIDRRQMRRVAASAVRTDEDVIHDLTASVESEVSSSATRVVVLYKLNSAFVAADSATPGASSRFAVQVHQALPFMNFSNAQWEMLVAVRSLFRDDLTAGSIYDEVLVVSPPQRFVGGLTVSF